MNSAGGALFGETISDCDESLQPLQTEELYPISLEYDLCVLCVTLVFDVYLGHGICPSGWHFQFCQGQVSDGLHSRSPYSSNEEHHVIPKYYLIRSRCIGYWEAPALSRSVSD